MVFRQTAITYTDLGNFKVFIGIAFLSTDLDKLFDIWCFTRSRPVQQALWVHSNIWIGKILLGNRSFESLCKYLFLLNRCLVTSDSVIKSSIIYMYIRHPWFLNTYRGNVCLLKLSRLTLAVINSNFNSSISFQWQFLQNCGNFCKGRLIFT